MANCRDRTNEFFSTANQLLQHKPKKSNGVVRNGYPSTVVHRPLVSQHRRAEQARALQAPGPAKFSQAAAQISHGIQDAAKKLETLARLAKRKSLFNDPAEEIQRLTFVIKEDIKTLNQEIDTLQDYMSSHRNQFGSDDSNAHSQTIVNTLKMDLASTTKNFSDVLHVRTKNLRAQSSRKNKFSSSRSLRHRTPQELHHRIAFEDEEKDPLIDPDDPGSKSDSQLTVHRERQDSYLQSRTAAVQQIESTIAELGQMYQRLAAIVAMQDEFCIRIDANVDDSVMNVNAGHTQLLKYFDRISGNRWLILKVFAILLAFAFIFVLFIA